MINGERKASMLQVIVMALIFGFAIILVGEKAQSVAENVDALNLVCMKCMEMILKLSPIGVFCLLCPVIATNGAAVIGSLAMVLLVAYLCYIIHMVVVYSLCVKAIGGISPMKFFKEQMPAMIFAFSSASSVGTLPINLKGVQKMERPRRLLPLCFLLELQLTWMVQQSIKVYARFL